MSKVKILDAHLTNMIAAGEVVERPAGIVKELVENSLDAGATIVDISVVEGGMSMIEISDNGHGMGPDDLKLAFERHSTSKISQESDLTAIKSFGFRGEALPSIASVSQVEVITKAKETYRMIVNNGVETAFERAARNQGTTLRVHNLFTQTPARLKYIKNIHYEGSVILDTVQKFALGSPNVAFSYTQDEKKSFQTYGNGNLVEVFQRIHNVKESIAFEGEDYDFKISGVLAKPQYTKSNRYSIWIYLNGRMIKFPKLAQAVVDAYRRHIPIDRFPIVTLNVQVDPQLVDVNVHPSKWEVRLSKEKECISLIMNTLEKYLETKAEVKKVDLIQKPIQEDMRDLLDAFTKPIIKSVFEPEPAYVAASLHERPEAVEKIIEEHVEKEGVETYQIEPLIVLSQMSGRYILAQGDQGLYIIDQHAAMERVRYEYYQNKYLNQNNPMQDLLLPMMIDAKPIHMSRLQDLNTYLAPFQLVLEALDESTLLLRSIPLWLKDTQIIESVILLMEAFERDAHLDEESFRRLALATFACHSSIRFNEFLSMDEMKSLVHDLRLCKQPLHCPHGRPTLILMDHKDLIKEFNR